MICFQCFPSFLSNLLPKPVPPLPATACHCPTLLILLTLFQLKTLPRRVGPGFAPPLHPATHRCQRCRQTQHQFPGAQVLRLRGQCCAVVTTTSATCTVSPHAGSLLSAAGLQPHYSSVDPAQGARVPCCTRTGGKRCVH